MIASNITGRTNLSRLEAFTRNANLSGLGHVEYRIVDEQEADVVPGDSGELLVRARGDNPRRGFFSHFAPPNPASGTGRTSPHERMATAGYSGYGSMSLVL